MHRITEFSGSHNSQPLVFLLQYEGMAVLVEGFAVAVQNCGAGAFYVHRQMAFFDCEGGADGEPYQIERVGEGGSFVEIVDAPDQAAFHVPPGAKILDVEIADGQQMRSFGDLGTDLGPDLYPAIERRSQEWKGGFGHALVLQAKIGFHERGVRTQPFFEVLCCLNDIHWRPGPR